MAGADLSTKEKTSDRPVSTGVKVTTHGVVLHEAMTLVRVVVPGRASRPILSNLLIERREGGGLDVAGTNMDTGMRVHIPPTDLLEAEGVGGYLVPATRLTAILKELASQEVTLTLKDLTVEVEAKGTKFKLVLDTGVEDYPTIPREPGGETPLVIPVETLQWLLKRTVFAVAPEESRYAVHAIKLEQDGRTVRIVATDGKRLAVAETRIPKGKGKTEVLVGAKALTYIPKLAASEDAVSSLYVEANRVVACMDRGLVVLSRVEGTFPTWEDVLPKDPPNVVNLDREEFTRCIRRGALLASEGSHSVCLAFGATTLVVSANVGNVGEGKIEMPVDWVKGGGGVLEIHFNPKYLLEFLKVTEADTVSVEMHGPGTAVLFQEVFDVADGSQAKAKERGSFRYVAMPVTLEGTE